MTKMKSFVKEVIARMKGDDAEAQAQKNYRKASAAVSATIASLGAKLVDDENTLEDAQENLASTKWPTTLIGSGETYLANVKGAQESVDAAQDKVEQTQKSIAYWQVFLSEMDSEA